MKIGTSGSQPTGRRRLYQKPTNAQIMNQRQREQMRANVAAAGEKLFAAKTSQSHGMVALALQMANAAVRAELDARLKSAFTNLDKRV